MKLISVIIVQFFFSYKLFSYTPQEGTIIGSFGPAIFSGLGKNSSSKAGLGLLIQGDVNHRGGLELGLYHYQHVYSLKYFGREKIEKINRINLTMGYRYWPYDVWGLSFAFSSAYAFGDKEIIKNDFQDSEGVATTAAKISEHGFIMSSIFDIWSFRHHAIHIHTFYHYSLNTNFGESADLYGLMIGYTFYIQSKAKKYGI